MSELSEFLAPYIERVEVSAIIGAVVENRLKQGLRLYIGHSTDIEILSEGHTFDMSNFNQALSLDDVSFTFVKFGYIGDNSLSEPRYDTLILLEDNGLDDVVLAHYKLKENDLVNLVGYFFI
jgi:hypothetical protein